MRIGVRLLARWRALGMSCVLRCCARWTLPPRRLTNDQRFRIHEGQTLTGTLRWGSEPVFFERHERTLSRAYELRWHDHVSLGGRNGEFRWLGVAVAAPGRDDVMPAGIPAAAP